MLFSVTRNNRDFASVGQSPAPEFWMLLFACYILSFGTFQDLGPLREAERMASETLTFDSVSAIKAITRLIAFILVAAGLLRTRRSSKWPFVRSRVLILALFGLWGAVSTIWSPMPLYSFGHALEFILLVMLSALAALVCDNPMRCGRALFHLCTIHFLYILVLIILSIATPGSARILRPAIEGEAVFYAAAFDTRFLVHPAVIAEIASMGLLLVIAARFLWHLRWARILFFPALIVESWVLFVTQTRAMIVTTLLLTGACLFFWGRGKLMAASFLICALIGISYLTLDPNLIRLDPVGEKIATYMTRGQSNEELRGLGGRVSNWTQVINGFLKSPIVGHGYSMATPTGKMWRGGTLRHYSAHNILLRVFAGTGLIGGMLFIWGFCWLFFPAYRGLRRFRDKRLRFFNLLIILFIFMTGVFSDSIVGPLDLISVATFVLLGIGIGNMPMPIDLPSTPIRATFKSKSIANERRIYE